MIFIPSDVILTAEEKFSIAEWHAQQLPDESPEDRAESVAAGVAEYYGTMAALFGKYAAGYAVYASSRPWTDRRLHMWDPNECGCDHWIVSMAHILARIPLEGHLLDLACGDGWYCYHAFRHRASKIVAVDRDKAAIAMAKRLWSDPGIDYVLADLCEYEPDAKFDVVSLRGTARLLDDLPRVLKMAHNALRPDGWFVGDDLATTTAIPVLTKALREEFGDGASWTTLVSRDRNTLIWSCRASCSTDRTP